MKNFTSKFILSILIIITVTIAPSFGQTYSGTKTVNSGKNMTLSVKVDSLAKTVELTMTGPDNAWFGYAFGASRMTGAYSIVRTGTNTINEKTLGNHSGGTNLTSSLSSSSYTKSGSIGTMKVKRNTKGSSSSYYTFSNAGGTITIMWAYGSSTSYGRHAGRGATTISLTRDCIPTRGSLDTAVCSSFQSPSKKFRWSKDGTYTDTIPNSTKCDSIITVKLKILRSNSNIDTATCGSYVSPAGKTLTKSGNYFEIIKNHRNCDSVVSIKLTILEPSDSTISISSCSPIKSPSGNHTWTKSGTFMDTISNFEGCDSVLTILFTLNSSTTSSQTVKTCDSYTSPSKKYSWRQSGKYNDTIVNFNGCDSIITTTLTIFNDNQNRKDTTFSVTSCESYTSPSGRFSWTKSGTYLDTIPSFVGCDSTMTIKLTIQKNSSSKINETVCRSFESPSKKYTWVKSGQYMDTIPSKVVCDSIITVNLTVLGETTATHKISACESYTSPSGKHTWTKTGSYMDTISNFLGCDSVMTIELTITTIDVTVTNNSPTLTANSTVGTYQWLDCNDNYKRITREVLQSFNARLDGSYAVEITNNGCIDTSKCELVANVGIIESTFVDQLRVFPNPTNRDIHISLGSIFENIQVKISDATGKVIEQKTFNKVDEIELTLDAPKGLYLISLTSSDGKQASLKVIKE